MIDALKSNQLLSKIGLRFSNKLTENTYLSE
jgi:hypothetical protein